MQHKSPGTKDHPEIIWDDLQTELLDKDPEEKEETYLAEGFDLFGNMYLGSALFTCDELERIEVTERI